MFIIHINQCVINMLQLRMVKMGSRMLSTGLMCVGGLTVFLLVPLMRLMSVFTAKPLCNEVPLFLID